ncbi:MAG: hypothetical protein E7476_00375 [Ruminococcaceae bacterium]|jgi:hypothetical protein|nr:hypothetical protein [Oscillospiraceae bacterium]
MKKLIAAAMAAVLALGVQVTAFAASVNTQTSNITALTGLPINENGKQVASAGDTIAPNQKIYYLIPPEAAKYLNDSKAFKLSVRKTTNGKYVSSVKLVEKKLLSGTGTNYYVPAGAAAINKNDAATYKTYAANARNTYLEIALKDTTSIDEFKVELTASFTARKANTSTGIQYAGGAQFFGNTTANKINPNDKLNLKVSFYMANDSDSGDATVTVGEKGVVVKPDANSNNEIVFEGSDTFATLTFKANDDPDKFYAKLSTKWTSALLAKFRNTDAVIRAFSPATIDSSSRATLALNNPFDEDVDPEDVYIYALNSKGALVNATTSFTYNEDDDTFEIKTRTLTTYIISDVRVRI